MRLSNNVVKLEFANFSIKKIFRQIEGRYGLARMSAKISRIFRRFLHYVKLTLISEKVMG